MIVIKNQEHVELLKSADVLGPEFLHHLTEFMVALQADLDDLSPNTYCIEDAGHLVIFEPGDNVRDLSNIGLHREQGLLGCIPDVIK